VKFYGYVSVSIKTGMMGRTLHKSLDCLSLRWSDWVTVSDKFFADKTKKCKRCFREDENESSKTT
jgi:hypothetical protein